MSVSWQISKLQIWKTQQPNLLLHIAFEKSEQTIFQQYIAVDKLQHCHYQTVFISHITNNLHIIFVETTHLTIITNHPLMYLRVKLETTAALWTTQVQFTIVCLWSIAFKSALDILAVFSPLLFSFFYFPFFSFLSSVSKTRVCRI